MMDASSKRIRLSPHVDSSSISKRLSLPMLWLLVIGLSLTSQVLFAKDQGVDAVLIIDSSGSMKQTDPKRLRVPAAKMFINLLGKNDRIGLISFSDNGYPVIHLTSVSQDNQKGIFSGIDKVSALGAYTNLHAALESGLNMLREESSADRRRMLVLMSDGKMDVGDWDMDQQLGKAIQEDLIATLAKENVEVYTIAFTEASDMSLMNRIAMGTGAMSRMASNDRELDKVFSTIFESAKQPDMLPLEEGGIFMVDGAVEEVTLIVSKAGPADEVFLEMPDGRRMTSANAGRAVRWFKSQLFDMVTIKRPPTGKWRLSSESDEGNDRVYVVTNLGIQAEFGDNEFSVAQEETATAWLKQDNGKLTKPEILENTVFGVEVEQPDGNTLQVPLVDSGMSGDSAANDGQYSGLLTLLQPGSHKLRFVAKGETFQREKIVFVEIPEPAADFVVPEPTPEPVKEVKPEPEALIASEPEPEPEPEPQLEPEPLVVESEVVESEIVESEEKVISIGMIVAVFVGMNILVALGVGLFIFMKKRKEGKASNTETVVADDSAEPEAEAVVEVGLDVDNDTEKAERL